MENTASYGEPEATYLVSNGKADVAKYGFIKGVTALVCPLGLRLEFRPAHKGDNA